MKRNILLFTIFITLLFFYPKNGLQLVTSTLAENRPLHVQNSKTETNPVLVISGTILNYTNGEGTVTENDFWTGDKTTIGTIDKNGNFTIPLDQDYFNTVKKKMDAEEENMPKGGEIRYHRVNTVFTCGSEGFGYKNTTENINDSISVVTYPRYNENNQATFKNGESIISKLPVLYLTDKQGNSHSLLYAANTPELATSSDFGVFEKGFYLEWIFVEHNSKVTGECAILTGSDNEEDFVSTTTTDVELQKGWNIIRYDITEVLTSSEGEAMAKITKISTISELPNDLKWYAIATEN
jgi:hypothetical protein